MLAWAGEQCLAEGLFLGGLGGALERRGGAGGWTWWRPHWEGEGRPRKLARSGLARGGRANEGGPPLAVCATALGSALLALFESITLQP